MPTRTLYLVCALLTLVLAAPARGATTIGDSATTPSGPGPGGNVYVQATDGAGGSYAVPAGGGVVTSVSARVAAAGTVLLVRAAGAGTYTVVGAQDLPTPSAPLEVTTAPARIPVAAGDRLAAFVPSGSGLGGAAGSSGTYAQFASSSAPAPRSTLSGGTDGGGSTVRLSISATVEPDADHDGYGDETQDSCPSSGALHEGACAADLSVGAVAAPASIVQGDVTTIVAPVTAHGSPVAGATLTLSVPAGLSVLAASTTGGDCVGTTCALGDLPAGQTRKAYIVVRGTAAGTYALGVSAASPLADANPADNAASATVTVTAPPAVAPPVVAPPVVPATVKLCRVPSLKGKTAAAAKSALARAGCNAGKSTGSKAKKAKVTSQTVPAGVQVVAGTKVGYALKAAARAKVRKPRR
jgi:Domain of unknown function DUF11/PASTA domain